MDRKIDKKERDVTMLHKRNRQEDMFQRCKDTLNHRLVFSDMPRPEQLLPAEQEDFVDNGFELDLRDGKPSIEIPQHFYGFNSPQTVFMLGLILDANNARLRRMLSQVHTRAMFREDRYYQLVDDPNLYYRDSNSSDKPAFHNKSMLYLTSIGIMVYLKQTEALLAASMVVGTGTLPRTKEAEAERERRQLARRQVQAEFQAAKDYEAIRNSSTPTPVFNVYAYQYATYVHCKVGDILRFQLDFLAIKRTFHDAFPLLMQMNWRPNDPSTILYRRKHYQYMTPFLDWVDTLRYILRRCPTLSVATIYSKMLSCHSSQFTLRDMLPMGTAMLEYFELRKLQASKFNEHAGKGMFIGRKILHNKTPQTSSTYASMFPETTVRPVIPHVCSPTRRFLVHLYYYDYNSMSSLATILSIIDLMLKMDFFSMHPMCKLSSIHLEPIIFQIYNFVWMIRKQNIDSKKYLRHEQWDTIRNNEESFAWYLRWDVLNCVSLLFGICQNALIRDLDEPVIDRIVMLIIEVLRSSEYLESVMVYSFYDTYFGLTSTVNCVPNLQSRCVLRVLKKLPLYLVENFDASTLLNMFTPRFFKSLGEKQLEQQNFEEISELLVMRKRRMSMETPTQGTQEEISQTSSMGSTGAVTLFNRNYETMREATIEDEQAMDTDKADSTRKEEAERQHVQEYKQSEIDFRYAQVFTDAYIQATGRHTVILDESKTFSDSKKNSGKLWSL